MKKDIEKYYKKLVDNRLIPSKENKIYKEFVLLLFSDCLEYISPQTVEETIKILQNLSQKSFEMGVCIGFKEALNSAKKGNPIIEDKARKQERKDAARKAGKYSGLKRNEKIEEFSRIFKEYKMNKMSHKEILEHPETERIRKKHGISITTVDKKWIPECKKKHKDVTRTS